MADEDRINVMHIEEETDQFTENNVKTEKEKKPRIRKTKEEQIAALEAQKAIHYEKIAKLEAKQKKLSLTPAEKKAAKKTAENHCKIIAGVTAFELAQKGKPFFTIDNFKNRLYNELTQPLEIAFLNRQFKEPESK